MQQCYNRGCGKTFDPEKNDDDSCCHHPGEPYFHDAYKGWSCCKKKSVDFTEFLNFKGCTLSKHSNVKPPEPEKEQNGAKVVDKNEVIEVRPPIKAAMARPSIEMPLVAVQPTVSPALKEAIDNIKSKLADTKASEKLEPGEVAVGTSCTNAGCTYSYTGTLRDNEECQHHTGVPVFHEGMKYWSCCQRKTTDFNVFMDQKGCSYGQHKWAKENGGKKEVHCRYDWHQTATNVIVSIYAKMYHYAQSTIEVNPIRLRVILVFPEQDNTKFNMDLELRGIIDVNKTTAHMFASKVEITMPKAEPGSWARLENPRPKLPPAAQKSNNAEIDKSKQCHNSESEVDDFNLDDIETFDTSFRLTEIASNKNNLD